MKRKTEVTIIPALPGHRIVAVDFEKKEVFTDIPIIAWRIETVRPEWADTHEPEYISHAYPISAQGDAISNQTAIMHPDGSIAHSDCYYDSIEDMRSRLFPVDGVAAVG